MSFWGILFIPFLIYVYVFYREIKCKTPGRKMVGIVVVDQARKEISFWRGLLREVIGKTVSGAVLYLGFIWAGFDQRKQAWHDKIASTYVIRRA